ncbi:acyl-CoA dehydrogenase [candidate division KSB1 bacterium]|nr:MAG: acyl-CoA dehydrogenase [candidate division KSB1 bacterium]
MDYLLTDEQIELRNLARKVAREKIKPIAAECDREGRFPWEIVELFRELDFFRIIVPEEYGGISGKSLDVCIVTEELSRACGGIALCLAATALGSYPIILDGTEEQKRKYLPRIANGEILTGFGLTESSAGSDAAAIKTTARREGNYYILNGTKQFITNGSVAKVYTVIAKTDPTKGTRGTSAFIVEEGYEGFSYGKKEDKMGIRASVTSELVFDNCKVPVENRIGAEGQGFIVAMRTLDKARPGVAAQAVGIAQGAFDLALEYIRTREQFGQTLSTFQGLQFMIAEMATKIEAARALIYATARMVDAGVRNISKECAMCKLLASDVAMEVTTKAVQLFGGYGYMRDYPIEKFMRDAKITQIYEGTNEIQKVVIARRLIKEGASK